MQQKSNNFLSAKDRILQYLDFKGYSQYYFSKKTGLSNGFLKSGSSVSSENIKLLSNVYSDLNIMWVITGEGNMIIKDTCIKQKTKNGNNIVASNGSTVNSSTSVDNRRYYSDSPDVLKAQIDDKDKLLREKDERLREKDERLCEKDAYILELKELIRELKSK
jgi:hypothetical protein